MTEHVHNWKPMEHVGATRYQCACGATGWRPVYGPNRGKIVAHTRARGPSTEKMKEGDDNMQGGGHRYGKRGPGGW